MEKIAKTSLNNWKGSMYLREQHIVARNGLKYLLDIESKES